MARSIPFRKRKSTPHQFNIRLDDPTKDIVSELERLDVDVPELARQVLKEELAKELKALKRTS